MVEFEFKRTPRTEGVNPRTIDLDLCDVYEIVELLVGVQVDALVRAATSLKDCARLVRGAAENLRRGGRLVYVAAGTSGRLAETDMSELTPTFGFPPDRLSMVRPSDGSGEDNVEVVSQLLKSLSLSDSDVVVALSASGTTPWVQRAADIAVQSGSFTIAVVNNTPKGLTPPACSVVVLDTGEEPISGSTRMSAGLSQKLFLATFSTAVMVLLGHTYGNLMTRATGQIAKLDRRRVNLVSVLTDLNFESSRDLLERAGGDVEVAVLCYRSSISIDEARSNLLNSGSLRAALGES